MATPMATNEDVPIVPQPEPLPVPQPEPQQPDPQLQPDPEQQQLELQQHEQQQQELQQQQHQQALEQQQQQQQHEQHDQHGMADPFPLMQPNQQNPATEQDKRKTEEELLANSNLSDEDRRRIKRRASNRESARRTRLKRTEKLKESEERSAALTDENDKISHQIRELEKLTYDAQLQNRAFKAEIAAIRAAKPHLNSVCPSIIPRSHPDPQALLGGPAPPAFAADLFASGALTSGVHPSLPMPAMGGHMFNMSTSESMALLGMPPPITMSAAMGAPMPQGSMPMAYDQPPAGVPASQPLPGVAPLSLGPGPMEGMLNAPAGAEAPEHNAATIHQMMLGIYQQSLLKKETPEVGADGTQLAGLPPGMHIPMPMHAAPGEVPPASVLPGYQPEQHGLPQPDHHEAVPQHEVPQHHDAIPQHHDAVPQHHEAVPQHEAPQHHEAIPQHHEAVPQHHEAVSQHEVPQHEQVMHHEMPQHEQHAVPQHHEAVSQHEVPQHEALQQHEAMTQQQQHEMPQQHEAPQQHELAHLAAQQHHEMPPQEQAVQHEVPQHHEVAPAEAIAGEVPPPAE